MTQSRTCGLIIRMLVFAIDSHVIAPRKLRRSDITASWEKSFLIINDCVSRSVESKATEQTGWLADRRLPTIRVTSGGTLGSSSATPASRRLAAPAGVFTKRFGTRLTVASIHPCLKSGSVKSPAFFKSRAIASITEVPRLLNPQRDSKSRIDIATRFGRSRLVASSRNCLSAVSNVRHLRPASASNGTMLSAGVISAIVQTACRVIHHEPDR